MHPLWPSLVSSNSQHWEHLKIGQGQTLVITAGGVDSEVCFRWEKPEQFWCLLRRARVGIATHTSREGEELGESEGRPETGQSCYWGALNTLGTMGERDQWRCRKVNVFCLVAAGKNVLFTKIKKGRETKDNGAFRVGRISSDCLFHSYVRQACVSFYRAHWLKPGNLSVERWAIISSSVK